MRAARCFNGYGGQAIRAVFGRDRSRRSLLLALQPVDIADEHEQDECDYDEVYEDIYELAVVYRDRTISLGACEGSVRS
jgi:hypothetical protein